MIFCVFRSLDVLKAMRSRQFGYIYPTGMCVKKPVTDDPHHHWCYAPGSAETPEHCFRSDRGVYGIWFLGGLKEDDRMIGFGRHVFTKIYAEVHTSWPTIALFGLREWDYNMWHQTNWDENRSMGATTVHGRKKTLVLNQNCPIEVMGLAWLIACSDSTPNRKPLFIVRVACFFCWLSNWVTPPSRTFSAMKIFINWKSLLSSLFWCSLLDDWKGWGGKSRSIHECKKDMRNKISRVLLLYFFFNSWFLEDPDKAPLILAELVGGSQWFEDAEVPFVGVVGGTVS